MRSDGGRRAATLVVLVGLIGSAFFMAACGGGSNGPGIATAANAAAHPSPTPSLSDQERLRRFTQCLRDHGVNVGDSTDGKVTITANKGDKDKVGTAMQACQSLAPAGKFGGKPSAAELANLRQFAKCMRDHGVPMADPDPNTGAIGMHGTGKDDPKVRAASEACKNLLPGANSSSGPHMQVGSGPGAGASGTTNGGGK